MQKMIQLCVFATAIAVGVCSASPPDAKQEPPRSTAAPKLFRLDFVVKEIEDGRTVNSRNYSIAASPDSPSASLRSGSKVPVNSEGSQSIYIDVGVNIDCHHVLAMDDRLSLEVTAEVSTSVPDKNNHPVILQNMWNAPVMVPFRKPKTIFSSDDVSSKRRMEVELTATPLLP